MRAISLLADGAAKGVQRLDEILSLFSDSDTGLLNNGERLQQVFTILKGASGDMEQAVLLLEEADAALQESRGTAQTGSTFIDALDRLERVLDQALPAFRFALSLAEIGPGIVGLDGERAYLLLGLSADELRASGGFVFACWLVTFRQGELSDIRYFDIAWVDDYTIWERYPNPPAGLSAHMNAPLWLLRDVTWEPDFPGVAETATHLFELGQKTLVDGVIAVNQWALERILDAVGPIEVEFDGTSVDVVNFLSVLEAGTDSHGRAYADAVLKGILDSLSGRLSASFAVNLALAFQEAADRKDLLFFSSDPVEQKAFSRIGWDGSMKQTSGDYLHIVDSNVGWNKADRNIKREFSYDVSVSEDGRSTGNLTLRYQNMSVPAAPCGDQWNPVDDSLSYEVLKNSCYWDFVRVYTPNGITYLQGDRIPLPPGSIYESIGFGSVGDDTLSVGSNHGKTVFSGLTAVPAGNTMQVTFQYALPDGVVRREGERISYELLLQAQPGVPGRSGTLTVQAPAGWSVARASGPPFSIDEGTVTFNFVLTSDTRLEVAMEPQAGTDSG
jgi:hypothetical protein